MSEQLCAICDRVEADSIHDTLAGKHNLEEALNHAFRTAVPVSETVPGTAAFFAEMSAHDRCDNAACGAQAYVRVQFRTGVLLFCAHHYATHLNTSINLERDALSIHDERDRLNSTSKLDVSA